jgi:hypothetical protein
MAHNYPAYGRAREPRVERRASRSGRLISRPDGNPSKEPARNLKPELPSAWSGGRYRGRSAVMRTQCRLGGSGPMRSRGLRPSELRLGRTMAIPFAITEGSARLSLMCRPTKRQPAAVAASTTARAPTIRTPSPVPWYMWSSYVAEGIKRSVTNARTSEATAATGQCERASSRGFYASRAHATSVSGRAAPRLLDPERLGAQPTCKRPGSLAASPGTSTLENVQVLCRRHNSAKRDR